MMGSDFSLWLLVCEELVFMRFGITGLSGIRGFWGLCFFFAVHEIWSLGFGVQAWGTYFWV